MLTIIQRTEILYTSSVYREKVRQINTKLAERYGKHPAVVAWHGMMVNENDLCYLGGYPAENLKEVFGIWNEEIDTLYPGQNVTIVSEGEVFEGIDYSELIHIKGAKVLATYDSEFYVGMPAATVHGFGKGKAYYQAFRDTGAFWEKMITTILDELNIRPTLPGDLPEGVCAHKREADGVEYIFVQNYSEYAVEDIDLGNEYLDMESGEVLNKVSLDAFDVKCLKR